MPRNKLDFIREIKRNIPLVKSKLERLKMKEIKKLNNCILDCLERLE